jgi:hypothetical protein
VQWARQIDQFDELGIDDIFKLLPGHQLRSNCSGVLTNSLKVLPGLLIATLGQLGKRENHHVSSFEHQQSLATFQSKPQFFVSERFSEVVVCTRIQSLQHAIRIRIAGE